jgi:hypothetical protein
VNKLALCDFEPSETTYSLSFITTGTGSVAQLDTTTLPASGTTSCLLSIPGNVSPAVAAVRIAFTPQPNFTDYSNLFFRLRANNNNVDQALNGQSASTFFKIEINNTDFNDTLYSFYAPFSTSPLGYSLRAGYWENVVVPFTRIGGIATPDNPGNTIQYIKFTLSTCPYDLSINLDTIQVQS